MPSGAKISGSRSVFGSGLGIGSSWPARAVGGRLRADQVRGDERRAALVEQLDVDGLRRGGGDRLAVRAGDGLEDADVLDDRAAGGDLPGAELLGLGHLGRLRRVLLGGAGERTLIDRDVEREQREVDVERVRVGGGAGRGRAGLGGRGQGQEQGAGGDEHGAGTAEGGHAGLPEVR
jgi:hypothetical protein